MAIPLVSTIIPTYNRADTICAAIESVLRQTYARIELIVVDDGSSDHTPQILANYGDKIQVIRQPNAGPSAARNRGIDAANGEIVAFLDSDDTWLPTKVEQQVASLQRAGKSVPCCLCNAIVRDPMGNELLSFDEAVLRPPYQEGIWLNVSMVLSSRFVFFNQAVAIRRDALAKTGGFDESLWFMEDYDMALRLAFIGPWAYIKEPLVIWQGGSRHSLCRQAEENPIRLQKCIERIYMNILSNEDIKCSTCARHLNRNLRLARRNLRIAQMCQRRSLWSPVILKAIGIMDKMRNAVFRRSPWYPKMEVVPLE